jgi:hypothetical protein
LGHDKNDIYPSRGSKRKILHFERCPKETRKMFTRKAQPAANDFLSTVR